MGIFCTSLSGNIGYTTNFQYSKIMKNEILSITLLEKEMLGYCWSVTRSSLFIYGTRTYGNQIVYKYNR